MKFGYLTKTFFATNFRRVKKYYNGMYGNHRKRAKREKPTAEAVQKNNIKKAVEKLFFLLITNFNANDYHLAFTYPKGTVQTAEEANAKITKFFRKYRAYCKKLGKKCKYIYTTEVGKRGGIHHHVILEKADLAVLQEMWTFGRIQFNALLYKDKDFYGLAQYLIDKTKGGTVDFETEPGKKKYIPSRDIEQPDIDVKKVDANTWRKNPKPPDGWIIKPDSLFNGIDEITGMPYQVYDLIPDIPAGKVKRKQ